MTTVNININGLAEGPKGARVDAMAAEKLGQDLNLAIGEHMKSTFPDAAERVAAEQDKGRSA